MLNRQRNGMPQEFRESDIEDDYSSAVNWNNSEPIMATYNTFSSESSEDEGPDVISNTVTKTDVLTELKKTNDAIQQQNELAKEKRRKRNDFLVSQKLAKKKRIEALEAMKLPEDVLAEISETNDTEKNNNQQSNSNKSKQKKNVSKRITNFEDITIPTTSTQFRIKSLDKQTNSVVAKSLELQQIKEKLLRGRCKREKTEKALAKLEKRKF